ncbi:MAG: uroporphyrinogen decarboxylase [Legionellaceae bacterium]|nr:uroporphyrinogen decarboxylase [Legionellaceae bacterium]
MSVEIEQSLLMRALRRQAVERTPVWIMRQAGRYLPEYRAVRAQAGDFMRLCRNPELACEVTLQPLRRFPLDAAILFSDILTIPDAMGLGLYFAEGEGPRFEYPIRNRQQIDHLPVIAIADALAYVMDAVTLIRREMPGDLPLLGFAGSPWTLACYMVEGQGSKTFATTNALREKDPSAMHALLEKLSLATSAYLNAQIHAGVNAVMLFDTWGGMLTTKDYQRFSLYYLCQIVQCVKAQHPHTPIILFTKGGCQWLEAMADSGADALGLDWNCSLGTARERVGDRVALQGNINPAVLLQSPEQIRIAVAQALADFGHANGHIFNLGHGITPDVPPEHLHILLETVHELSPAYHQ